MSLPGEAGGRLWRDLPDWRIRVWEYPDGIEVCANQLGFRETRSLSSRLLGLPPPRRAARGQSADREANREAAARRAKTQMRRRIRAGGFDRMLTLTYRANMVDSARALRDWQRFVRRMKRLLGDFPYVAVLERQARGAWHIHAAVRGYMHANVVRGVWWSIVGRGQGNIDLGRARKGGSARVARYMAKYMGKTFDGSDFNRKRYWASESIDTAPTFSTFLEPDAFPGGGDLETVGRVLEELLPFFGGRVPSQSWISLGGGVIWLASG